MGVRTDILNELKAVIETMPEITKVEVEKIVTDIEDVNPSDIPYVQIFDNGPDVITPAKTEDDHAWPLAIELVMRRTPLLNVNQTLFLDTLDLLEAKISANRGSLEVSGFQHLLYNNAETSISSEDDDIFVGRLLFTALYSVDITC